MKKAPCEGAFFGGCLAIIDQSAFFSYLLSRPLTEPGINRTLRLCLPGYVYFQG